MSNHKLFHNTIYHHHQPPKPKAPQPHLHQTKRSQSPSAKPYSKYYTHSIHQHLTKKNLHTLLNKNTYLYSTKTIYQILTTHHNTSKSNTLNSPTPLHKTQTTHQTPKQTIILKHQQTKKPNQINIILPIHNPQHIQPLHHHLNHPVPQKHPTHHSTNQTNHLPTTNHPQNPHITHHHNTPQHTKPITFLLTYLNITKTHSHPYTSSTTPTQNQTSKH